MRSFLFSLFFSLSAALSVSASPGFTDPSMLLYGRVVQPAGGSPYLVQSGEMVLVLRNTERPENTVTLTVPLAPAGVGNPQPYSFAVALPLKNDPPAYELDEYIDVESEGVLIDVVSILVNGEPSTVASETDLQLFVSPGDRGLERRLDILAGGEPEDRNGDGVPDAWLDLHELTGLDRLGSADPDNDGLNNKEEFELGTDPNLANTDPQILSREITVTQEGVAGLALRIVDADTTPENVSITVRSLPAGIELQRDGTALGLSDTFTAADLNAGRLTLVHSAGTGGLLGLSIEDETPGPEDVDIQVSVFHPSPAGAQQAALWLDAQSLPDSPGDPVGSWSDRSGRLDGSGTPYAFMQGDAGSQPTLVSTADGKAVRFGEGAHLLASDVSLPGSTRALYLLHAVPQTETEVQTLFKSNALTLDLAPFDAPVGYPGAASLTVQDLQLMGFRTPLDSASLQAWKLTESGGYALSKGLYDGTAQSGTSEFSPVIPALGASVELDPFNPAQRRVSHSYQGDVYEALVYDRMLPTPFAENVENYLLSRWKGAVVWNLSESLTGLTVSGSTAPDMMIGGFGPDTFDGGDGPDILSGGPGSNHMTGGAGPDIFRYRAKDTGNDILTDFDVEEDFLDLSGRFAGISGNVADHITLNPRVEIQGTTVVVSTELGLHIDGNTGTDPDQLLILQGIALNGSSLGLLVGEGALVVGDLLVPEQMSLGELAVTVRDAPGNRVEVVLTRSGNSTHREEVPLQLTGTAEKGIDFRLLGTEGTPNRPVAVFERGQSTAFFRVAVTPDTLDEAPESLDVALVSRPRNYQVSGGPTSISIEEAPLVTLTASDPLIETVSGGTGTLRIERSGSVAEALEVKLVVQGTAVEGSDFQPLPDPAWIPVGHSFVEIEILPLETATAGKQLRVSLDPLSTDSSPALPASASFHFVEGSFEDWIAVNDPASAGRSPAEVASEDHNHDGITNFQAYVGGELQLEVDPASNGRDFHVVLPHNLPDLNITLLSATDPGGPWTPDPDTVAAGSDPAHPQGIAFILQRTPAGPEPGVQFFRGTATFRDPLPDLTPPSDLFASDSFAGVTGGDAAWVPQAGEGVGISGLPANGESTFSVTAEGPGDFIFEWRHDGAADTVFGVHLNGREISELLLPTAWTQVTIPLSSGSQVISWTLTNSGSEPGGDAAVRRIRVEAP
ncbi:hypothetical protein P0Y35_13265 [Kiritimatiellaeota bacterium B1221]|nr:hypothetical protein [Kiritimatiellaeota bacterium B1221]